MRNEISIAISKVQLKNLLEVLEQRQSRDDSVSDIIEVQLVETCDVQLRGDKVKFYARSVYSDCNNHFLGVGGV